VTGKTGKTGITGMAQVIKVVETKRGGIKTDGTIRTVHRRGRTKEIMCLYSKVINGDVITLMVTTENRRVVKQVRRAIQDKLIHLPNCQTN